MKLLTLIGTTLITMAVSFSVSANPLLADRHSARGVSCESCHNVKTPAPGAVVSDQKCQTCHGDLDKVAQRTQKVDPNPHYNHLVNLDCME